MAEEKAAASEKEEKKEAGDVHIEEVEDKKTEEKDAIDKVGDKVDEAKAVEKANKELEAESNIEEKKEGEITKGERTLSAIGYILFFCILPLVLKQKSEFCQFHGKQGLVLCICYLVFSFFGFIHWVLELIILLIYVVFVILGIVNSVEGRFWEVPLIGRIAKKLNFD